MKKFKEDLSLLLRLFLNHKKKILKLCFLFTFLIISAFMIVGGRLFYPNHLFIGLSLIILSIFIFVYLIFSYRRIFIRFHTYEFSKKYFSKHKRHLLEFFSAFLVIVLFFYFFPLHQNPFKNLSNEELNKKINEDLVHSVLLLDQLEIAGNELLSSNLLIKKSFSADERKKLEKLWINFLIATYNAEKITEIYRYFHFISPFSQSKEHSKAFLIVYSLYVKKYEILKNIISQVQDSQAAKKILNEKIALFGKKNIYKNISARYFYPNTIAKINLGRLYLSHVIENSDHKVEQYEYFQLKDVAKKSYASIVDDFDGDLFNGVKVGMDALEKNIFEVWLPIQKNVSIAMSRTSLSNREKAFITLEQIKEMEKYLEPGDIILQRRNWAVSNIGIPGFWVHSVLYTGSLSEMENYFANDFPYHHYKNVEDYLEKNFPDILDLHKNYDDNDDEFKIIEVKEPGVIIRSLEQAFQADYMAVLRPKLERKDKMLAIFRAFENYSKPYDFDFDFETRDAFVCSELIYDAYQSNSEKQGLSMPSSLLYGRKVMSTLDIAKKYRDEKDNNDAELEFIYFLDGNEEDQIATRKYEDDFIKTIDRSKYEIFLD